MGESCENWSNGRVSRCDGDAIGSHRFFLISSIRNPKTRWFIMENPIKMDDLGVPLFLETARWCSKEILTISWWWFQICLILTSNLGEIFQFDKHIFQMG